MHIREFDLDSQGKLIRGVVEAPTPLRKTTNILNISTLIFIPGDGGEYPNDNYCIK